MLLLFFVVVFVAVVVGCCYEWPFSMLFVAVCNPHLLLRKILQLLTKALLLLFVAFVVVVVAVAVVVVVVVVVVIVVKGQFDSRVTVFVMPCFLNSWWGLVLVTFWRCCCCCLVLVTWCWCRCWRCCCYRWWW